MSRAVAPKSQCPVENSGELLHPPVLLISGGLTDLGLLRIGLGLGSFYWGLGLDAEI